MSSISDPCQQSAPIPSLVGLSALFQHAVPLHQLGEKHCSYESYSNAVRRGETSEEKDASTNYSLVVLLSPTLSGISIMLGKKLRGFGKGFYTCFGGKLKPCNNELNQPAKAAIREVLEETGMDIPLSVMEKGYVGVLNFTFEDYHINKDMKVYLFCVLLSMTSEKKGMQNKTTLDNDKIVVESFEQHAHHTIDPITIQGCDEIEPIWFTNIYDIPLHQMFADDTVWLTLLLKYYDTSFQQKRTRQIKPLCHAKDTHLSIPKLHFDAWFHFHKGGAETNSIMHYYIKTSHIDSTFITESFTTELNKYSIDEKFNPLPIDQKYSLEKWLFHALHRKQIHSPSIKEFKENWAMVNAVRRFMCERERIEYVIDVAGGHGALAALFLILVPKCHSAIVIDPAIVGGKDGIKQAWSKFWDANTSLHEIKRIKTLRYRHECLSIGLHKELSAILQHKSKENDCNESIPLPANVLVVACHACQHLTDETMRIASEYGVHVACMPCCQKDHDGWWKGLTKQLMSGGGSKSFSSNFLFGTTMDLLSAGKMLAWNTGLKSGVKYQVKIKLINEDISPFHNRIILCKAVKRSSEEKNKNIVSAHQKLMKAYKRAHKHEKSHDIVVSDANVESWQKLNDEWGSNLHNATKKICMTSLFTGLIIGTIFSCIVLKYRR